MITETISYSDLISILALLVALGALAWNIVRDICLDRVQIDLTMAFGEGGNIKGTSTTLFAAAGSLVPKHKFSKDKEVLCVSVVNKGRRPVVISGVGGQYKTGKEISLVLEGLPTLINPYEIFSRTIKIPEDLISSIIKGDLEKIWVVDSKRKKWLLSKREWKILKKTANYIDSNKNI